MSPVVNNRTTIRSVSAKGILGFFSIHGVFLKAHFSAFTKKREAFFAARHRAQGFRRMGGGGCFDNELDIELEFINIDHALSLQLMPSFYKASFSTNHDTDFR